MHGSNRLGGNSLSDLLVFGRRAGAGRGGLRGRAGRDPAGGRDRRRGRRGASGRCCRSPRATEGGENPFVVHLELQKTMHELVGIIRKEDEM